VGRREGWPGREKKEEGEAWRPWASLGELLGGQASRRW
jgi:hypothetical protein